MGLREQLTKRPRTSAALLGVVIVLCVALSVWELQNGGRPPLADIPDQAFYTTDDGKTLFPDSISKIPPIDHNGTTAVRARVYTCDGGKHQWVAFLEKYSDADKRFLESPPSSPPPQTTKSPLTLVKKPGDSDWVPQRDPKGLAVMELKCPDGMGGGKIEPVLP